MALSILLAGARRLWHKLPVMMLERDEEPPKGWQASAERFRSLGEAWNVCRRVGREVGDANYAFRWHAIVGSTWVIGVFWFP